MTSTIAYIDVMIIVMNQFFFEDGLGCFWARQLEITLMISTSVPTLTGLLWN